MDKYLLFRLLAYLQGDIYLLYAHTPLANAFTYFLITS